MKSQHLDKLKTTLALAATLALTFGVPLAAGAYDQDGVKKVKVKGNKVKVKMVDGKAKIKNKPNGKHKVKVKGYNGDIAASIAEDAAHGDHHSHGPAPYYGK